MNICVSLLGFKGLTTVLPLISKDKKKIDPILYSSCSSFKIWIVLQGKCHELEVRAEAWYLRLRDLLCNAMINTGHVFGETMVRK